MDSTGFSLVYNLKNLDTNYSFLYLLSLIIVKELKKIIARTLCFMHQRIFRPIYIFDNYAYFFRFSRTKIPFDLFEFKSFLTSTSPAFGVSNYEKQHKEGTCKVLGRSVVFSAFYEDFCFCSKLVIITTLKICQFWYMQKEKTVVKCTLQMCRLH